MTEHDARALAPKNKPADDREALAEFARTHWFCQACGAASNNLTIHHIIGGRGGRADEPCNLLYLCWEPCHMLAEGLDVRGPTWGEVNYDMKNYGTLAGEMRVHNELLPKITLGIALAMKIRAGELVGPTVCVACGGNGMLQGWIHDAARPNSSKWECPTCEGSGLMTSPEWDRLTALHGRNLPAPEPIPAFFAEAFRRNRPELNR